ncbi:MAG TPA: hypothetical protein VJ742_05585, partial [Nitrososphaera sp.]|nr:hypothetical protein [Nitrososphaera sp.]
MVHLGVVSSEAIHSAYWSGFVPGYLVSSADHPSVIVIVKDWHTRIGVEGTASEPEFLSGSESLLFWHQSTLNGITDGTFNTDVRTSKDVIGTGLFSVIDSQNLHVEAIYGLSLFSYDFPTASVTEERVEDSTTNAHPRIVAHSTKSLSTLLNP